MAFTLLRRTYTDVGRGALPGGARGADGADGDAARPERVSTRAPSAVRARRAANRTSDAIRTREIFCVMHMYKKSVSFRSDEMSHSFCGTR